MKEFVHVLFLCFVLSLAGCSTVEGDAQKAAELNKESMELIRDNEMIEAEKRYKDSQKIIEQYKGTEKFEEFYEAYNKYVFDEK